MFPSAELTEAGPQAGGGHQEVDTESETLEPGGKVRDTFCTSVWGGDLLGDGD